MNIQKAAKQVSLLWIGSLIGAGCAFLTQIILARQLGAVSFGVFSSALATVMLLAPLAGFGVSQYWLKIFGEEGWGAIRWLASSFNFVLLSVLFVLIVIVIWAVVGPHDEFTKNLLIILSFCVLGQVANELVSSKFQLEERYFELAVWQLMPNLLRLVFVSLLVFSFSYWMSVKSIAVIYSAIAIVFVMIAIMQLSCMTQDKMNLKGHVKSKDNNLLSSPNVKLVMQQAWPFGMAGFFHLIYYNSDIILLKYMVGDESAGVYSVAFTIMMAVYLLPSVVYQKFLLPKMHRWANKDRVKFFKVYRIGNIVMFVLGMTGLLVLWTVSSTVIPILFGEGYNSSVILLNVLAVSVPMIFVAFSVGATLVTQEHMRLKVKFMGTVALVNLFLNFIFIPIYGAVGAAVTTVVSNFVLLVLYYYGAQTVVFSKRAL